MIAIQCKEHQLWSADPIKAMKAFYDCQTRQVCSQKKNFENNYIDHRHWATDLNDVREALNEYNEKHFFEMSNSRKLKSDTWRYFTYVDEHYAKCDICKTKISHKTTMSNLKKHIERKHPLINLQPEVDDEINQPITSSSNRAQVTTLGFQSIPTVSLRQVNPSTLIVEENVDDPSSSVESSNHIIKKRKTTNTLLNYIPRKMTNTYQSQLDDSLLKLIYLDCQPFNITENEGFKQFVNLLNPAYKLPRLADVCEKLKNKPFDSSVKGTIKVLQDGINYRFSDLEMSNTLRMATFLDPKFKHYALTKSLGDQTKTKVINAVAQYIRNNSNNTETLPVVEERNECCIWNNFDSMTSAITPQGTNTSKAIIETVLITNQSHQSPLIFKIVAVTNSDTVVAVTKERRRDFTPITSALSMT
ncbi:hypothetical protein ACI65C_004960 [Semiaphis heraclei]